MVPRRGSHSSFPDQQGTELQDHPTPRIAVTDLEPSTSSSDSSSTPPASSPTSSTSPGSLPRTPPSPQTSLSSVDPSDVADCAVQNAQRVTESLDGDTIFAVGEDDKWSDDDDDLEPASPKGSDDEHARLTSQASNSRKND